jgi:putative sterol carrier protein
MSDPSHDFMNRINEQGFDARLGRVRGTLRFDVVDDGRVEHWLVSLDRGAIHASRGADAAADCVVRLNEATLGGVVTGEVNPTSALLRGEIVATGNIDLLLYLQRVFPSRHNTQDGNRTASAGRHDG